MRLYTWSGVKYTMEHPVGLWIIFLFFFPRSIVGPFPLSGQGAWAPVSPCIKTAVHGECVLSVKGYFGTMRVCFRDNGPGPGGECCKNVPANHLPRPSPSRPRAGLGAPPLMQDSPACRVSLTPSNWLLTRVFWLWKIVHCAKKTTKNVIYFHFFFVKVTGSHCRWAKEPHAVPEPPTPVLSQSVKSDTVWMWRMKTDAFTVTSKIRHPTISW